MPPTTKITKEAIQEAALKIIHAQGFEQLNAREIARTLNCSTQPIFTAYANMHELKNDVYDIASDLFNHAFDQVEPGETIFEKVAKRYIAFALEETNLFRFLFMSNYYAGKQLTDFFSGKPNAQIDNGIPVNFDLNSSAANTMMINMWIYAHGIAAMIATNQLTISPEEIDDRVSSVFRAFVNEQTREEENHEKQTGI